VILVVTLDAGFDGRAVGTGIDVARALHARGHEVMVTGLVDAETGAAIRVDVLGAGLRESLFDLVGTRVTISDWADFVGGFYALAARASAVVLSGGLRDGLPADAFAQLGRTTSTPVVLDPSGAVDLIMEKLDAHTDR
jgi:tagatose 6-phosphate kinase